MEVCLHSLWLPQERHIRHQLVGLDVDGFAVVCELVKASVCLCLVGVNLVGLHCVPRSIPVGGISSNGRALALHARGTGIDTRILHTLFFFFFFFSRTFGCSFEFNSYTEMCL